MMRGVTMIRRIVLLLLVICFGRLALGAAATQEASPVRGLRVVVAADAPKEIQDAAKAILAAADQSPLMKLLAGDEGVQLISSTPDLLTNAQQFKELAFNHIILVGLPTDPIVQASWERDARLINDGGQPGLYVFGFGNLLGDVGLIESDRNPFLHSQMVKIAPYEDEIITITGSTPAAVALAADSFIHNRVINAVVAPKFTRGDTTILDRDPALPPQFFPQQLGDWTLAGLTQASEDEYRGVLQDTGVEPLTIVRAKYYEKGVWDFVGAENSEPEYHAGLHRLSYGNSLWAAKFESPEQAKALAPKIAGAAHLHRQPGKSGDPLIYVGQQPPYAWGKGKDVTSGPLALWQRGAWVFMSTLPRDTDAAAINIEAP